MSRYVLFLIIIITMYSIPAYAGTRTVEINTHPENVKARVYRIDPEYNSKILGKCKTPCKIKFRVKKSGDFEYYVTFSKKGYVSERDIKLNIGGNVDNVMRVEQTLKTEAAASSEWHAKLEAERKATEAAALENKKRKIATCKEKALKDPALDRPAEPCWRITPVMPTNFPSDDFSGYCNVVFDVNVVGDIENIKANCTDIVLEKPTLESVGEWQYSPRRMNGKNVRTYGIESRINFVTLDERGNPLPFPPEP